MFSFAFFTLLSFFNILILLGFLFFIISLLCFNFFKLLSEIFYTEYILRNEI